MEKNKYLQKLFLVESRYILDQSTSNEFDLGVPLSQFDTVSNKKASWENRNYN